MEIGPWVEELRRRRVFRALVGYGVAALLVLRASDALLQAAHLPEWILSVEVVALGLGFVVTVVLAWVFDLTSKGVERTEAQRPAAPGLPRGARLWAAAFALGLIAAAPGLVYYFALRGGRAERAEAADASIAVLPFVDMSPQKDQEYFSDGIAEEILNALAHVDGLRVAGRTSSFSFKGKNEDLSDIARKLHVGTVLEGSVRKEGSRLRITAQLISAGNGYHLWSETFDRELTGVFAVQDEIARAVVEALRVKLLPGKGPPAVASRATSLEAYNQVLLGRRFMRLGTLEGARRGQEAFEKALSLAPGYAPAQAELAFAIWGTYALGGPLYTLAEVARIQEAGMAAAEKAIALDPALAEGYRARGYFRAGITFDWAGSIADLERALSLSPGDPLILSTYGRVVASQGRVADGIAASRKAAEIDPLAPAGWGALCQLLQTAGPLAEARAACERWLDIAPDAIWGRFWLATTFLLEGKTETALASYQRLPDIALRLQGVAMAQHDLGRGAEADQAMARLIATHAQDSQYQVAEAYAWRGDADRAYTWLERAFAERDGGVSWVKYDPLLRKVVADPRYPILLRKMKLPAD